VVAHQQDDEQPLVQLSLFEDGLPTLFEVLEVEKAGQKSAALFGLQLVV
jgi:hypothetical protein